MALPNKFGDNDGKTPEQSPVMGGLASFCMERVRHGRTTRDDRYGERWKEYTRLWRGIWDKRDKNTDSERSKLISPATMQAVEMTVAEMEEAVFSKQAWFDIQDDMRDEERDDALAYRDQLLEDFELASVPDHIVEVFLMGVVYGTGIAKINVSNKMEPKMVGTGTETEQRIAVEMEAIRPDQFVIDPAALTIDEAAYCAHEFVKPRSYIQRKQRQGVYTKAPLGSWNGETKAFTEGRDRNNTTDSQTDAVFITEFYGLVPGAMLPGTDSPGMVEALVTIANEGVVLKAVENPFRMKDRPVIAYQHDAVPGEFWGRGVPEKGYNPQKALDAELRARVDHLALSTAPMMGADITRLPRNPDLRVRPGKNLFTRGRPSEILEPIAMGNPASLGPSFQHASDLERQVQMATGAMDSATPMDTARRNETVGGMGMMQGGFIKRSKRAMRKVEADFLVPLIRKSLWRYMQFAPQKYPQDMKFLPKATLGIMAKELENQQLIQMLGFLEAGSPAHNMIVSAIVDNTASANKREMKAALAEMSKPPSEEEQARQQMQQQMQMEALKQELREKTLTNDKLEAEIAKVQAETYHTTVKADLEDDKVEISAANAVTGAERVRVGDRQNATNRERNQIEAAKAAQGGDNAGTRTP